LEAARRGCHLFIEKPLSHSHEGVDELAGVVERQHLVSLVACNMRFHPGPAKLAELLAADAIGSVLAARIQASSYLPGWRPWQDYRQSYSASPEWGGILLDGIHEIDLALWLLGPAKLLFAAHRPAISLGLNTDGIAELVLAHDSGPFASIHLNFVQRDYRRTIQLIGERGTLDWDFTAGHVRHFGPDGRLSETFGPPPNWTLNDMYVDELRHFLACVAGKQATVNPIRGGIAALEIALAARGWNARTQRQAA
jgi:predicted dehydrogenase